ncbi:unnamed protein product, partial [Nesidiocoris tenuis]
MVHKARSVRRRDAARPVLRKSVDSGRQRKSAHSGVRTQECFWTNDTGVLILPIDT